MDIDRIDRIDCIGRIDRIGHKGIDLRQYHKSLNHKYHKEIHHSNPPLDYNFLHNNYWNRDYNLTNIDVVYEVLDHQQLYIHLIFIFIVNRTKAA